MNHPEVALIDCEDCRDYEYEKGKRLERNGQQFRRTKPAPCRLCPKVVDEPDDSRNWQAGKARTITWRNWKTIERYWEQQACGGAVCDRLARRNFGIIHEIMEYHRLSLSQLIASRPVYEVKRGGR